LYKKIEKYYITFIKHAMFDIVKLAFLVKSGEKGFSNESNNGLSLKSLRHESVTGCPHIHSHIPRELLSITFSSVK